MVFKNHKDLFNYDKMIHLENKTFQMFCMQIHKVMQTSKSYFNQCSGIVLLANAHRIMSHITDVPSPSSIFNYFSYLRLLTYWHLFSEITFHYKQGNNITSIYTNSYLFFKEAIKVKRGQNSFYWKENLKSLCSSVERINSAFVGLPNSLKFSLYAF